MNAIRCRELTKTYEGRDGRVEAVRGIDLTVSAGECFGLLGPNGAGKTTTVEMLEGLIPPTSGEIEVLGRSYANGTEAIRQRLGISLQDTRFSEKLTVQETIELFGSFYEKRRDTEGLLDELGLTEKRKSWVAKLSGGQRQRLAVACALVGNPELLFLDEPTTGLDPQSRRHLWERVHTFREAGGTVMLTTHYMEEAEKLCDRVAIVDHGKVIALGSPRDLIERLGGNQVVEVAIAKENGGQKIGEEVLTKLAAVREVFREGDSFVITTSELKTSLPVILSTLEDQGAVIDHLATRQASLEDVFVSLTGRHLRDN